MRYKRIVIKQFYVLSKTSFSAPGINTEQLAPEYRTALEQLRGGLRGPNIQLFSLLLMDMFNQTHLIDTGPPIPKIPVHERQKPSTECTICNAKMPSDVQLHEHMTRRHIVKLLGTVVYICLQN